MNVYTAEQMRAFDRKAIAEYGIPGIVLMENASLRVVEFLEAKFSPLAGKRIVVLCGKGNNGGDGLAVARHLYNAGSKVIVVLACSPDDLKGEALINYQALAKTGAEEGYVEELHLVTLQSPEERVTLERIGVKPGIGGSLIPEHAPDIIIDALLGTGFKGEIRDKRLLEVLEVWRAYAAIKISIDLPSGLNADTGEASPAFVPDMMPDDGEDGEDGEDDEDEQHVFPGPAVSADYTITLAAPKRGLLVRDGLEACGEIWVGDVGNFRDFFGYTQWAHDAGLYGRTETGVTCLTRRWAHHRKPRRTIDAHKGDAGRVLICGGSIGLSGAPAIATRAALKIGAGLCTAALSAPVLQTLSARESEPTGHALPADEMGRLKPEAAEELAKIWKSMNVVAVGPGLSREDDPLEFTRRVVRTCPHPLILDADALYALPSIADEVKTRQAPTVLTPHPGEMGELMSIKTGQVQEDRFGVVLACAQKYNAITVLKGARTLVAHPDGRIWVNLTGNPGMATGGSGDALTGTIAGILAQGRTEIYIDFADEAEEAAYMYQTQLQDSLYATLFGVYIHGLAGDLAYQKLGNGLIAGDIVEHLPAALLELDKPGTPPINARLRKLE